MIQMTTRKRLSLLLEQEKATLYVNCIATHDDIAHIDHLFELKNDFFHIKHAQALVGELSAVLNRQAKRVIEKAV